MSLSTKIKRIFGFQSSDDIYDGDDADLCAADVDTELPVDSVVAPQQPGVDRSRVYDELMALSRSLREHLDMFGSESRSTIGASEQSVDSAELEQLRRERAEFAGQRERMEQMRLSAERQKRALTDRVYDLQTRVEELEAANEKLRFGNVAGSQADNVDNAETAAEIERLKTENERLTQLNEQLDLKSRMADQMVSELKTKVDVAQQESAKMAADLKVVEEIHAQLEKVQQVVDRKDARIAELTKTADEAREKLKQVVDERESMRKTIEHNLYNQAHSEQALRREIKTLEKKLAKSTGAVEQPEKKSARKKISAIDESLDDPDWFDSTPPPGTGKPDAGENPDFGYQAPQRKKLPDNDAQMSLW